MTSDEYGATEAQQISLLKKKKHDFQRRLNLLL